MLKDIKTKMNKLYNFSFVGDFPMFDSSDPGKSIFALENNDLQSLSHEIYFSPDDHCRAGCGLKDNYKGNNDIQSLFDEIYFSSDEYFTTIGGMKIYCKGKIVADTLPMNVSDRKPEKVPKSSDSIFEESEVINLYYSNENPLKERKGKYSCKIGKENKHGKRRRNTRSN
ncbi:uncharacterized protein LOC126878891 isoform X1 [Diabrotica virgifera virgifera]|uniref:Uncharacterized protein n=1 Tax=Diabrotica virgifera virgifera TaxID=50390 RepID=A0ABM5JIH6_DIAVI|nr:uncharacterized protein LOC126878891 isoform X1 [Diabrotica virgifera virgifera]